MLRCALRCFVGVSEQRWYIWMSISVGGVILSGLRRAVFALALAIVVSSVTIAFATTARASTDKPVWTAGDFWRYDVTGPPPVPGYPSITGSFRIDVVGTEPVTVGATSMETYHAKINETTTYTSGGTTTTTLTLLGDQWYRTTDFAEAKSSLSFSFGTGSFTETQTNDPPPGLRWPLSEGAGWSSTYNATIVFVAGSLTQITVETLFASYSVQADVSVAVPAGTFTATPVTEVSGLYQNVTFWSAAAGGWVKVGRFGPYGSEQHMDLAAYRHQGSGEAASGSFGLPSFAWILVAVVGVLVAGILVAWKRRRRPQIPQVVPPPGVPSEQPPGGAGGPSGVGGPPPPGTPPT